jgi:cytochrome c-type biogenesis protein CcmH
LPDTTVRLTPAQVTEWEIAAKAILCDCGCHPQSIKDCACGRAAEMRDEVATLIAQGPSGDQVIAQLVAQRGEKILVVPAATGFNLLAWLGPLAALFLLAAAMAVVLRRWRSKSPPALEPAPAGPAADDPYAAQLAREMREYDR